MLTKTLRFDDATLNILRQMDWQKDGTIGIITNGQLDRKLYESVNKALTAMGGKWKRGLGHVFSEDPRPSVEGLLTTGTVILERDGFFETPEAVVLKMLEIVPLPDTPCDILEPSAGTGAILKVLSKNSKVRHEYGICEKNDERFRVLCALSDSLFSSAIGLSHRDFMTFSLEPHFDRVYMNPPFEEGQDGDHVHHAYNLLAPDGQLISVMGEGIFFRNDQKSTSWRIWADSIGMQNIQLPDGSFKESGTGVNTRLVWCAK